MIPINSDAMNKKNYSNVNHPNNIKWKFWRFQPRANINQEILLTVVVANFDEFFLEGSRCLPLDVILS